MQDRQGTNDLANGAIRYGIYSTSGTLLRYVWIRLEDEPLEYETPLTTQTLLTAQTAARVWKNKQVPIDPTVNDAFEQLIEPSYKVGDILTTVRELAAPWHLCDGSTFSQTAYPDLYTVLGGTTLPNISYSDDTGTYIKMTNA